MLQSSMLAGKHIRRFTPATVIGFLLPLAFAACIGLALRAYTKPVSSPITVGVNAEQAKSSSSVSGTTGLPSAADIASADAVILNYCRNDLRQGTNCTLVANTNLTAPGFVESGVRMSGYFEGHSTTTNGLALAKGSGASWTVLWVGQDCIPKNVASDNGVTQPLQVCQ